MTAPAERPVPVVIYDRLRLPNLSGELGVRVDWCRTWARVHGYPVVGLQVDEGAAAAFDGPMGGDWPLISHGRPRLAAALGLVIQYGGALLVSRRDRLSAHNRCIDALLARWPVPLLIADTLVTTALPVRPGGHG